MEGYKNPDNKAAAENWRLLMTRNMETLHYCGCAEALEKFVAETGLSTAAVSQHPHCVQ